MEMPRLSKDIRKVVQLQRDQDGTLVPNVIYKAEGRKKKGTSMLRPLERSVRKVMRSQSEFAGTYLGKHSRSNQKRTDGWIKDITSNVAKAESKGRKALMKNGLRWPTTMMGMA